jgi:hypothetical protein
VLGTSNLRTPAVLGTRRLRTPAVLETTRPRASALLRYGCPVGSLLRGMLGTVVLATLVLALAVLPFPGLLGAALGLAAAVLGPRVARRVSEPTWHRAGTFAAVGFSLAGVAWALATDSMQPSDFGVYWRCGTTPTSSLSAQLDLCQSHYLAATPLYWLRSLLYTTPFGALVGPRPQALDLFNALLHAAALGLLLVLARRALGPAAATVAVVAWGLFPERLFAITLATPDNLAALAVLAVLAFASSEGRAAPRLLLLGLALAALELLRNAGPIYAAAVLLAALASAPGQARRLAGAVASVALGLLLVRGLVAALPGTWESVGVLRALSAVDLSSRQTFDVALRWFDHVLPAVPADVRTRFALRALATELAGHGTLYPGYLLAKAQLMFSGTGYAGWAALALPDNPDTALTVAQPTVPAVSPALLGGLLGFVLAMALVGAARLRRAPLLVVSLAVVATFFAAVLLFSEAQPRYLFVIGPPLALLCAAPFAKDEPLRDLSAWRGALVLLALALLFAAWARVEARQPSPLEAARADVDASCGGAPVLKGSLQRLAVELPAGVTCATVHVPLERAAHVRLVMTQASFPFPFEPRPDPALDWSFGDAASAPRGHFGTSLAQYVEFTPDGAELVLHVARSEAAAPAALELAHLQVDGAR